MIITFVTETGEEKEIDSKDIDMEDVTYYDGKFYSKKHPDIIRCFHCNLFIHQNLSYQGCCLKCANITHHNLIYCLDCKHIHLKNTSCNMLKDLQDVDTSIVIFGNSVSVQTRSYSFSAKGESTVMEMVEKIGQYQSERELPKDIYDTIKTFYHGSNIFKKYYYWGDYKVEGDVKYLNVSRFRDILYRLKDIKYDIDSIKNGYKLSPYRNYTLVGITGDGMIEWAKYDLMGKEKHWTEKPNNFLQSIGVEIDNKEASMNLHYVLSSDLEHKLLAFKMNPKFGSCQKSENYDSYALGAYDAITNGCNCPILIYKEGCKTPMGRITCRVMYDKEGKEYFLLERLYHDGTLGDSDVRGKMYANIAYDLKSKGYNVIASNYSAHDSSTYSYLAKYGLSSKTKVNDLVQPLRQIPNNYGYYCDGGTKVYRYDIDGIYWATDYLDEAYLI